MPGAKAFIDTNVLLYLLSADARKADTAESIFQTGPVISVQVLNETANVARRKLNMSWAEIHEFLELIRSLCPTEPITVETHDTGLAIAQQYTLSVYDGMIVAAALLAECEILYSEGMQDGLVIEQQLRIVNPFHIDSTLE